MYNKIINKQHVENAFSEKTWNLSIKSRHNDMYEQTSDKDLVNNRENVQERKMASHLTRNRRKFAKICIAKHTLPPPVIFSKLIPFYPEA